jgi:type IV pilus assembly protein PilY1
MRARLCSAFWSAGLLLALVGFAPGTASAQAVITNGDGVALGVNAAGELNFTDTSSGIIPYNSGGPVGVAFFTDYNTGAGAQWGDATSPGCLCEGWGVAGTASGTTHSGYANISSDGGAVNLTVDSFTSTASTAVSTVHLTDLAGLQVTQDYHPSSSSALYEDSVTITNNTGGELTDVMYKRVMDWDIPPTTFDELVTLQGVGLGDLVDSCDDGFETANPTVACSGILFTNQNATDSGPTDHGALFTFNFGSLADGASKTFSIFYGAAATEAGAFAALSAVGAEGIYSFGQCDSRVASCEGSTGGPATFIFGFGGVGAPPIGETPEPASLLLLGGGLAAAARRYRRA